MLNTFYTGYLFIFFKVIRDCEQNYGKTDERIFMKYVGKVRHETRINLEHFRDLAVNVLNPGSIIFIFWIRVC